MPGLILPQRFIAQPQGPLQLDRSNPIARSITHMMPLNGDLRELVTGNRIALTSTGKMEPSSRGMALRGNGSQSVGSVSLNLADTGPTGHILTVSFWLYWDAFSGDDDFAFEHTSDINTVAGGFYFNPNASTIGRAQVSYRIAGVGYKAASFTRPSGAAWHHYMIAMKRDELAGGGTKVVVDGVLQSLTWDLSVNGNVNPWANSNFYFFSRNNASLFGAGRLQNLTFRLGDINAWNDPVSIAREEYKNPWQVFKPQPLRLFFDTVAGGTHATTGSLAAQSASIAGTAAHKTLRATSGALASQSAVIAGSAARVAGFVTHETSGALSAASATVSGTAVHPHVTSGALAAQSAIIVGVAERSVAGLHDTTGALASGAATIAGTAVHVGIHATTGTLAAQSAVIAGTSVHSGNISLTEADIAAIWAYEIEPGVSAKVAMQRLMSVIGGKVSGAGSGTETFRDINDTRDALVSVNDSNGNRTSLTWTDGA